MLRPIIYLLKYLNLLNFLTFVGYEFFEKNIDFVVTGNGSLKMLNRF
jgi:hypothetical protein